MKTVKRLCTLLFICFSLIMPIHAENMDDPADVPVTPPRYDEVFPMCEIDDYECINDNVENAPASTPEDIQQAIRSFNPEIAAKEQDKNYLKHFTNSALTATTSTLSLDIGYTIGIFVMNSLVSVVEAIGSIISLIALTIYNFVSGSTIESLLGGIFDTISKSIFDWSNLRSWVYNLLFLLAGVGIVQKILDLMKRQAGFQSNRQILGIVSSTILSVCVIVFIGLYGRPIIHSIETLAENSIASTFSFSEHSDNMEIETKTKIFDLMQMKPFMMRHFGTTSIDRIPTDLEKVEGDLYEFNSGRVQAMIANPSTSQAINEKKLGNTAIMQGYGTAAACLFNSFLGLIHKVIAGCIVIIMCLVVGCVRMFKELLLFFSIFGLIFMLMKPNPKTYQWFFNRISWTVITIVTTIMFDVALYAWCSLIDAVTTWGFIFAIVVDILLVVCCILAWKNKDTLLEKFKEKQAELSGFTSGIFNGTLSPQVAYDKVSSTFHKNDDELNDNPNALEKFQKASNSTSNELVNNNELADNDIDSIEENMEYDLSDEADGLSNKDSIEELKNDLKKVNHHTKVSKSEELAENIVSDNESSTSGDRLSEVESISTDENDNSETNENTFTEANEDLISIDEELVDKDDVQENLDDKMTNDVTVKDNNTNQLLENEIEVGTSNQIQNNKKLEDEVENVETQPIKVDEELTDYYIEQQEKIVKINDQKKGEKYKDSVNMLKDENKDFIPTNNEELKDKQTVEIVNEETQNNSDFIMKQSSEDLNENEEQEEIELDLSDYD